MLSCQPALCLAAALLLSACGSAPASSDQEVEEFAARIGNSSKTPPTARSASSTQIENSAPAKGAAPIESDINPICGAPKVAPFFGRKADNITREAVLAAVAPNSDVRFIDAGSDVIPVPSSSRLNVKVDVMGIIRSATCG